MMEERTRKIKVIYVFDGKPDPPVRKEYKVRQLESGQYQIQSYGEWINVKENNEGELVWICRVSGSIDGIGIN